MGRGQAVALLLVLALSAATAPLFAQQKIRVVTTSADLKSLVEAVGGPLVDAESLAAPEQDPHGIELKPVQLARARSAALLVRVGLDHEPWFAKLKLPREVRVLDASRNVRLLQTETPRLRAERRAHVHAYGNTHYWLFPLNALAITGDIRDALVELSPRDRSLFDDNQRLFAAALKKRVAAWESALAPFRDARLVVMHDSWSYLADAFGLQIVAAAEPHPGVPPSPAELSALIGRMREAGVKILVADPASNPALVRQIVEKTGARSVTLAPSGHDYLRLLDDNVARLASTLRRDAR